MPFNANERHFKPIVLLLHFVPGKYGGPVLDRVFLRNRRGFVPVTFTRMWIKRFVHARPFPREEEDGHWDKRYRKRGIRWHGNGFLRIFG